MMRRGGESDFSGKEYKSYTLDFDDNGRDIKA